MQKKKSADVVHHYIKQLKKHSEKMKNGFNEDAIHDFRVAGKKLRSFLRMMRPGAEEPELLKYTRQFKKMYSTAGKIRDRQLLMKRIKAINKNYQGKKLNTLKEEIKDLTAKKNDFLTRKNFEEMEENILRHLPVISGNTLMKDFIHQKLNAINEIVVKGDYKDKDLHSIRKSIKNIVCVTGISRDDLKVRPPVSFGNEAELKKAENLSHELGLFNDVSVALSFLMPAHINRSNSKEIEYLQSIRRRWLAEKRKLKKDILDQMPRIKMPTGKVG